MLIGCNEIPKSPLPTIRFPSEKERATPIEEQSFEPDAGIKVECGLPIPSPGAKGLSSYNAALPLLALTTKIVPVIYTKRPQRASDIKARQISAKLADSNRLRKEIRSLLKKHKKNKSLLRKIFLREGYLFEDRPVFARAMVSEISLANLFDEPYVFRYHKGAIDRLERSQDEYVDTDGNRAKLLLNDRVALKLSELALPIHIDLTEVRRLTGAQRTLPLVVGEKAAACELVFPNGERRQALIELREGQTRISCIAGNPETLKITLGQAEDFWQQHRRIMNAVKLLVAERPRFDEPKDEAEDVQEDGQLRLAWTKAYRRRKRTFKLREVEYPVFDRRGNPIPPQVCVDFVFDVWERSSGTWFERRGRRPGRTTGQIDFSLIRDLYRRNIPSILEFAAREDTPLYRYDIHRRHWIPLLKRRRLATVLARHTDAIREGDALIIHGLREEDMENHYHAAIVLLTDPLTGVPMVVADNQGWPRVGSLEQAMRNAPRRSIKYRLRIDFDEMRRYITRITNPDAGSP